MTEDEAKAKWCPFIRMTADGPGEWHTNRAGGDSPGDASSYRCIASACMAWRLDSARSGTDDLIREIKNYRAQHLCDLLTAKLAVEARRPKPEPSGYCGLAGQPS